MDLTRTAEKLGFSYAWTFDSHVLWQEPFVIYSRILAETSGLVVGPMVTNPGTRDWTVLASLFATLNEMFGERTICGMGRGDSALRYIGKQPTTLATMVQLFGEEDGFEFINLSSCSYLGLHGHPAVLELIGHVVRVGRELGRDVSLCGDMGGDPIHLPALIARGLKTVSVAPPLVGRTKLALAGIEAAA